VTEHGGAGTAVVATGCGWEPIDVPALAASVRALADDGWAAVVVTPSAPVARALTLALGESRAGRRAVPVLPHLLVDPLDPALAHPPETRAPEPLAVLEAESIGGLVRSGFTVVVAGHEAVVPDGPLYRPVEANLDAAAGARRLAGDLGAGVLVLVTGADGPSAEGDVDHVAAEGWLDADPPCAAEVLAAVRFVRAGGQVAVFTPAAFGADALAEGCPAADLGILRVHRTLARPSPVAPALAAGWC